MASPKRTTFPGHKVIATVKSVKGKCSWGHEVGDTFDINIHNTAGLCGQFYHDIYPHLCVLQFGASYPWCADNPDVVVAQCQDYKNLVTLELRREKK